MSDSKPPTEGSEPQNEKWYEKTRYQILLFAGGIVLFVLLGGWILDWYIEPKTSGQKKDLVQALGFLTAGVAGAIGIIFTWRGQRQARRAQEENQWSTQQQLNLTRKSQEGSQITSQAQLDNAQEELRLTRQGQITERFTRAIDQLGATDDEGNKLFEIRLGGIYALDRISRESEEDHWPIMEILTAYVRRHKPLVPEVESREKEIRLPDSDIQAIMTVLRRRIRYYENGEPEPIDLRLTNLQGVNLQEANLQGANLQEANLQGANLQGAKLQGAKLAGATLAILGETRANLRGADLRDASLNADLRGADLRQAKLGSADLMGANLRQADLRGADFSDAELYHAQLHGADLRIFREGEPGAADWEELASTPKAAMLAETVKETTGLTQEQLANVKGDKYTELPDHLQVGILEEAGADDY